MAEKLSVDPALLQAAATRLEELTYPAPLSPFYLPARDPVSAAIDETLPVIEAPVINGLPAIKAANTRTGSRLAVAASIYADTDRRLADYLSQLEVSSTSQTRPPAVSRLPGGRAMHWPDDARRHGPARAAPAAQFVPAPAQLGQISELATAVGPTAQHVQAVTSVLQGAVQGAGTNIGTRPDNPAHPPAKEYPGDEGDAPGEQALPNVFRSATADASQFAPTGTTF